MFLPQPSETKAREEQFKLMKSVDTILLGRVTYQMPWAITQRHVQRKAFADELIAHLVLRKDCLKLSHKLVRRSS